MMAADETALCRAAHVVSLAVDIGGGHRSIATASGFSVAAAAVSEVLAPALVDFDTGQDLPEIEEAEKLLKWRLYKPRCPRDR